MRFLRELEAAVPEFQVMMKVRAAALLRRVGGSEQERKRLLRRVSQKEFDFVLVKQSCAACAIELDDRTHELPERRSRDRQLDRICARAGQEVALWHAKSVIAGQAGEAEACDLVDGGPRTDRAGTLAPLVEAELEARPGAAGADVEVERRVADAELGQMSLAASAVITPPSMYSVSVKTMVPST